MKQLLFSAFLLSFGYTGHTQSLTIINKTSLDLHFKLTASLEICDRYCLSNAVIKANTTIVYSKVDSVYWSCEKKPLHFSSFALTGNKEVSSCGHRSSNVASSFATSIAYSWVEDEKTKNATVVLEPAAMTKK